MNSSTSHLVGVAIPTLIELRAAVLASNAPESAVTALREAGFAGGDAVHAAFEQWLSESGESVTAADLPLEEFGEHTSRFFLGAGWGDVSFSEDEAEGVAIVDIVNCWEGGAEGAAGTHGCHVTTGLLASFFGRIAGYPIAVLETECCEGQGTRCRFLMGNADVMQHHWERALGTES